MFSVYCKRHGAKVLLCPDNIVSIHNDEGAILVDWECYCGETGSYVQPTPRRPALAA